MEADSLPTFINNPEFQELRARSKAMVEADAEGLKPPANARPWADRANFSVEEKIALREHAIEQKKAKDQRNLEFHRKAIALLQTPDEPAAWVKAHALQQLQRWEDRKLCNPRYVEIWRCWLDLPADIARTEILREDDLGIVTRCNTPLNFLRRDV